MSWQCRNAMRCTTDGCTAKAEIEALREKVAALTAERDEVADYANRIADSKHEQLAAAQAHIKELREVVAHHIKKRQLDDDHELCQAFSTPNDSSALDARLAAEYDRGYQESKDKYGDLT